MSPEISLVCTKKSEQKPVTGSSASDRDVDSQILLAGRHHTAERSFAERASSCTVQTTRIEGRKVGCRPFPKSAMDAKILQEKNRYMMCTHVIGYLLQCSPGSPLRTVPELQTGSYALKIKTTEESAR